MNDVEENLDDIDIKVKRTFESELYRVHKLTLSDIKDAYYIGEIDDTGSFKGNHNDLDTWPLDARPSYVKQCYCGNNIKINCHIYSEKAKMILTIGSDCVKHFIEKGKKRVCVNCHEPTRVKTNACAKCRDIKEWIPVWEVKRLFKAKSYKIDQIGVTQSGLPKVLVTFALDRCGTSITKQCQGVERISKAGNKYVNVLLTIEEKFLTR